MNSIYSNISQQADDIVYSKTDAENWELSLSEIEELINTLQPLFEELRKAVVDTDFENEAEEILFFKEVKANVLSKLIYFKEVYAIEIGKPIVSYAMQHEHFMEKARKLKLFFDDNLDFYQYYRSKSTYFDKQYFLRGHFNFKLCLGCINYDRDPQFSTCYDHKVAMILCNEMLRIYVNKKLHSLERIEQIDKIRKDLPVHPFIWTDPKNAAVELGYAIYAKGSLNNGNVDIKEIMTYLESSFNIDLGDYYRTYLSLKGRKRGQTLFLDSLKEALIKKMNDDDRL